MLGLLKKKKYQIENTRQFSRLNAGYLVKYQRVNSPEEPRVSNIRNLSAGGLLFWTDASLEIGTLLRLSFWLPPLDRTVNTLARVLWVYPSKDHRIHAIAVAFVEISLDDQAILNEFVEYFLKSGDSRSFYSAPAAKYAARP